MDIQSLKKIAFKWKSDIVCLGLLLLFFVLICVVTSKNDMPLADFGREVYVPKLILEGKVLYKDVFMMHPPLGYLLNSLLFRILGCSLNVLFWASIVNGFLILVELYTLLRLIEIRSGGAFAVSALVYAAVCNSIHGVSDYVHLYSYGMFYAVTAFLFFVICSVVYLKYDSFGKRRLLTCLASFSLGLACAFKQDFVLVFVPYFAVLCKKENWKNILLNLSGFAIPPLACLAFLFLQGVRVSDFAEFLSFQHNLINTPQWHKFTFYSYFNTPFAIVNKFVIALCSLLTFVIYFFINTYILRNLFRKFEWKNLLWLALFLAFNLLLMFINVPFSKSDTEFFLIVLFYSYLFLFAWVIITLGASCVYKYITDASDKHLFLYLFLVSLMCTVRECFVLFSYGKFLGILPLALSLAFVYQLELKDCTKKAFSAMLIFYALMLTGVGGIRNSRNVPVDTPKGEFYMNVSKAEVYQNLVDDILKNTEKTDRILVLPEAPLLNFVTDRPTDNKLYQLSPDHLEAYGEDRVIKDLSKNPPEYIVLQKIDYSVYGQSFVGVNFGFKLKEYILENYKTVAFFKNKNFGAVVFKRL